MVFVSRVFSSVSMLVCVRRVVDGCEVVVRVVYRLEVVV